LSFARRGRIYLSDSSQTCHQALQAQRLNTMSEDFEMPDALVFTEAAALKVKSLIEEEGNPDLMLRRLFRFSVRLYI